MSYQEVRDLPIRAFWFMNSQVSRVRAEVDLRELGLKVCAQTQGGLESKRGQLLLELGEVVVGDPLAELNEPRDEAGFNELRMMSQGFM
jgi:hypothetical protein